MKPSGLIRPVDNLGRIVIPKELRRTMDIQEGQQMEIISTQNEITLRKYRPGCVFCGSAKDVRKVMSVTVCRKCAASMANTFEVAE